MSKNRKNAMIYFAAAVFLAVASILNIKTKDWVFVAICAASAIVFFIAGWLAHQNIKQSRAKKSESKKKAKKK